MATRTVLGVLLMGVAAGPAALLLTARTAPTAAPAVLRVDDGTAGRDRLRAAGAAEDLVRRWMVAGRDDTATLTGLVLQPPARWTLPTHRPTGPRSVVVVDATPTTAGIWAVRLDAAGGVAGGGATYTVPVLVTADRAVALTLPGRVADPVPSTPPTWRPDPLSATHPAAVAVGGFAAALLAGTGDLDRWTAPDAGLTAVTPAPCAAVAADVATDGGGVPVTPTQGGTAAVLATVTCTTGGDTTQTLQYRLDLRGRDGRWEVTGYTDAPTPSDPVPTDPVPTDPGPSDPVPTPRARPADPEGDPP